MQAISVRDRAAGVGGLSLTDIPYPHAAQNDVIVRGACRRIHPRRTGLVVDLDRPRRARPDAERAWPRAVGSRRRVGVRNHRPDRRPAGVRYDRLDPQRLPGRVRRGGGPQSRSPSGRHRPHRGRCPAHLGADGVTLIDPALGESRPTARWRSVVLPAPFGPTSPTTLPAGIHRVQSWSAHLRPYCLPSPLASTTPLMRHPRRKSCGTRCGRSPRCHRA